jgi:hypothetical protein
MHAVANYPQRAIRAEPLMPRRALPSLLAALGVLAFIFSATCPDDDDIQQEFLQSNKSKQCVFANYKALSNVSTRRIYTLHPALAPPTPEIASHYLTTYVPITGNEIKCRISSRTTGDRSPPTKSS